MVNSSSRGEQASVKSKITFFSTLGMIVFLGLFIIVGLTALFAYDRSNLDSIVCTVSSVEDEVGPRTGTSILINTQECGQLRFSDGVTSENWKSVAENLKPDSRYEFQVGKISKVAMSIAGSIGWSVSVWSFREL
jgi:hypothetical protein